MSVITTKFWMSPCAAGDRWVWALSALFSIEKIHTCCCLVYSWSTPEFTFYESLRARKGNVVQGWVRRTLQVDLSQSGYSGRKLLSFTEVLEISSWQSRAVARHCCQAGDRDCWAKWSLFWSYFYWGKNSASPSLHNTVGVKLFKHLYLHKKGATILHKTKVLKRSGQNHWDSKIQAIKVASSGSMKRTAMVIHRLPILTPVRKDNYCDKTKRFFLFSNESVRLTILKDTCKSSKLSKGNHKLTSFALLCFALGTWASDP